jgi:KipI family sensor histidine kinase inhibitor
MLETYYTLIETLDLQEWKITDILPTYTTIAVHFSLDSPLLQDMNALNDLLHDASINAKAFTPKHHDIFVDYVGEDLEDLAKTLTLSAEQIIQRHSQPTYTIAMLGFRPYFPYLLELDASLHAPRRDTARLKVPQGSVAIGGKQTGVYSKESPGGWHIIGHTEFDDYEKFKAGDTIRFIDKHANKENNAH